MPDNFLFVLAKRKYSWWILVVSLCRFTCVIFFVPSVKTVQISNANLKYKSQKQISNTNLKCKSQMQVQNANLKCNDQIRRIPGNVGKQEWMGGSEDVQYTIRLGTCLTECLSCPLCRDVSNLKCRTKFEEYLESKDRQCCRNVAIMCLVNLWPARLGKLSIMG